MRCEECLDKLDNAERLEKNLKRRKKRQAKQETEDEMVAEVVAMLDRLTDIFIGRDVTVTFETRVIK